MIDFRWLTLAVVVLLSATYLWQFTKRLPITEKIESRYDYIIVGAGAAGSVLANRLTEDETVKVLLLEAGEDTSDEYDSDVPYAALDLQASHSQDWNDFTEPQEQACQSMKDKRCRLVRGKVVGGTSAINCMMYSRGSRDDYDRWLSDYGCDGWSYADVLPYFIKSEDNTNTHFVNSGYHGRDGPVVVSDVRGTSLSEAFIVAGVELGYSAVDINGQQQQGVMHTQATVNRGRRLSASRAFLRPVAQRTNLHIVVRAHVTKIIFDGNRAVGVQFMHNGSAVKTVHVNKEVLLSAGTIGSAKLLMLSGVGPSEHLTQLNIPVVADLPVGNNLQVPVGFLAAEYTLKEPIASTEFKASSLLAKIDYFLFGTGFRSSPCHIEGAVFSNLPNSSLQSSASVELRMLNTLFGNSRESLFRLAAITNFDEEMVQLYHGNVEMQDGLSLMPIVLRPRSVGTVRLRSANANDSPVIDPKLLTEKEDIDAAIEAVRLSEKFSETAMFKSLGAKLLGRSHPLCASLEEGNAYWECYVRHNAFPIVHRMGGTCRMGKVGDELSVVDSNLRVQGLEGIRVIDASVMPQIISGDTYAAEVMIAEKASNLIMGRITVEPV